MVSWFSAGVSSAVATKLLADELDRVIYTHIDDQHPDTLRFVRDCEAWFGISVEILQSPYKDVATAWKMSGMHRPRTPQGAPCTKYLKRRVRREWELQQTEPLTYVWGIDCTEEKRVEGIERAMPEQSHRFPLIENGIDKAHAHEILRASGVKRPAMYDLGFHNNNCMGCVKGGAGYWNHIRRVLPDVFAARAKLEREIGGSCLKTNPPKGEKAQPIWLDELDPESGRHAGPICDDCGIMCELMSISNAQVDAPSGATAERR